MSQTLAANIRGRVADEELASTMAKLFSPASGESYSGLPDDKRIAVASLSDSTKYIFGNGIPFPGYEQWNSGAGVDTVTKVPVMKPGSTYNLIVVMFPMMAAQGFWRMEYTDDATSEQYVRAGVLPSGTAIIRNKVKYMYTRIGTDPTSTNVAAGLVVAQDSPTESVLLSQLAGRWRCPSASLTSHLDAPDLANQGMVSTCSIGQSFDVNGTTPALIQDNTGAVKSSSFVAPFLQWTGPLLTANTSNIQSIVQVLANDPIAFAEGTLKQRGSYDIVRSADLKWQPGLAHQIDNPLLTGAFPAHPSPTFAGLTSIGIPDPSVSPQVICYSGVSAQATLNIRAEANMDIEPEAGSDLNPFKKIPPACSTKVTRFLNAFADCAANLPRSYPADYNDTGVLSKAITSAFDMASKRDPEGSQAVKAISPKKAALKGGVDFANGIVKGVFDPANVKARNERITVVKPQTVQARQDGKTMRFVAKQQTKQARAARKKR